MTDLIKSAYSGVLGQDMAALMAGRVSGNNDGGNGGAEAAPKKKSGTHILRKGLGSLFGR